MTDARRHFAKVIDEACLAGRGLAFVESLRARGREVFAERGLPGTRDEDWKYTSLEAFAKVPFVRAKARAATTSSRLLPAEVLAGPRLVIANGVIDHASSRLLGVGRGVRVLGLRQALVEHQELIEPWLGQIASASTHGLLALNQALFDDGFVVLAERGADLGGSLHVVCAAAPGDNEARLTRNLVLAAEGSRLALVEHFVGDDLGASFTSAVTEVLVRDGAEVKHTRLVEEGEGALHHSALAARVERDAKLESHIIAERARLARLETSIVLCEPKASCVANGLYLPRGEQHLDCFTRIEHRAPHTTSRQIYKGVIEDHGRGVWTGRVVVAEGADKTSARQSNGNLLLSDDARVNTRPELEIYADDVECAHGASVGSLDEEALFYLRSRGIGRAKARGILTRAFVDEVLMKLPEAALAGALRAALVLGSMSEREEVV